MNIVVAHGIVDSGELEYAVQDQAAAARATTVEVEDELVEEEVGQVRLIDRALVGAEQPALGQRGHLVHAGQQLRRVLTGGALERPVDIEVLGRGRGRTASRR